MRSHTKSIQPLLNSMELQSCPTSVTVVFILYLLSGVSICVVYVLSSMHIRNNMTTGGIPTFPAHQLAVVVPIDAGNIDHALRTIRKWPSTCYPDTRRNTIDLILYYAGAEENWIPTYFGEDIDRLDSSCFATTKFLFGHLTEEEHSYPKNLGGHFYDIFLNQEVRHHLSSYHYLALLQLDEIVGQDSLERLYHAASESQEAFGVKGSIHSGVSLHPTTEMPGSWYLNDIYRSIDGAFVGFLEDNSNQQEYALRSGSSIPVKTKVNYPFSWFLWQQYSHRFVGPTLINRASSLDENDKREQNRGATEMSFVRGSINGQESNNSGGRTYLRHAGGENTISNNGEQCTSLCGSRHQPLPPGLSTVCDSSCFPRGGEDPRFGGYLCGAGDATRYGDGCRLCYTDLDEAQTADEALREHRIRDTREGLQEDCEEGRHVIMCDTLAPPPARGCHSDCTQETKTVCDMRCRDDFSEGMNCNWRGSGALCRPCFTNVELARATNVFGREEGRAPVIMCDTHEPPLPETCKLKDAEGNMRSL
ncbi:unnamed protein product [Choristocarpus tenellus]